jgi:hypothetical protein
VDEVIRKAWLLDGYILFVLLLCCRYQELFFWVCLKQARRFCAQGWSLDERVRVWEGADNIVHPRTRKVVRSECGEGMVDGRCGVLIPDVYLPT